jgi:hypothetical protein
VERHSLLGLVAKVTDTTVDVAVSADDYDESHVGRSDEQHLRLDLSSSQKTFKVMSEALNSLREQFSRGHPLASLLFCPPNQDLRPRALDCGQSLEAKMLFGDLREEGVEIKGDLNVSQQRAVVTAMSSTFSMVHGPPGTGKTSTLAGKNMSATAFAMHY